MEKSAYKNMWVYIEHDKKTVAPVSLELCCEARKLCDVTGEKLVAVILGELPEEEVAKIRGCAVDEIILVNGSLSCARSTCPPQCLWAAPPTAAILLPVLPCS